MGEIPVACTLTPGELRTAAATYKTASQIYQARVHVQIGCAVVGLVGDKGLLGPFLRSMVAREERCCAFAQFHLSERPDGYTLRLTAPSLGAEELEAMVSLLFPAAQR